MYCWSKIKGGRDRMINVQVRVAYLTSKGYNMNVNHIHKCIHNNTKGAHNTSYYCSRTRRMIMSTSPSLCSRTCAKTHQKMTTIHQQTMRYIITTSVINRPTKCITIHNINTSMTVHTHKHCYKYHHYSSSSKCQEKKSPFAIIQEKTPKGKIQRKQPKGKIPINKTPRGQIAMMKGNDHSNNDQNDKNLLNSNHATGDKNDNNAELSLFTSSSDFDHTHFVRGGTHCDHPRAPFHLDDYGDSSLYTLILLRHGESEWNSQNRYTGWCDVNLTSKGKVEARKAGTLLKDNEIELDHVFTSVLKRAIFTTNMALNAAGQQWVPVTKSWRLNERHYGALQGYNKDTAYEELGIDQELVMEMRRSYNTRPPRMENDHPFWHGNDRRYKNLSEEQLDKTRSESLKDAADRILPMYQSQIIPSLRAGNKCAIISHANTIRTLIKHIDNISDEDIKGMSIPTGIPLLYRLDKNMKPVDPKMELEFRYLIEPKGFTWATSRQHGFHGVYLGDVERLQEIQRKRDMTNRDWQRVILRNIAKQLDDKLIHGNTSSGAACDGVMEIRQLYFQIRSKMKVKEFDNMLLLVRMKRRLEELMFTRKQRYLTMEAFEDIVDKLHLDAEGHVVEPFVDMNDEVGRVQRAKEYEEMLTLDLEEECLIK